jgi:hypothetical protein
VGPIYSRLQLEKTGKDPFESGLTGIQVGAVHRIFALTSTEQRGPTGPASLCGRYTRDVLYSGKRTDKKKKKKKKIRALVYLNWIIQVIQKKDIVRQQGKPKRKKKENGSPGGSRLKYPVDRGETSCDRAGSTLPKVYRLRDWEPFGVSLPVHKSSREHTPAGSVTHYSPQHSY